jgi:hypothetical protein
LIVPPPGLGTRIGKVPIPIVSLPLSYSLLTPFGTGIGRPLSATGPSIFAW